MGKFDICIFEGTYTEHFYLFIYFYFLGSVYKRYITSYFIFIFSCLPPFVTELITTLQIINQASWQETFQALWLSALRLVQRVGAVIFYLFILLFYWYPASAHTTIRNVESRYLFKQFFPLLLG